MEGISQQCYIQENTVMAKLNVVSLKQDERSLQNVGKNGCLVDPQLKARNLEVDALNAG